MTQAIETAIQQVEKYDTDAKSRDVVYGKTAQVAEADNGKVAV